MSGTTLNDLVREQILAEGPDIASEREYSDQNHYKEACREYVDQQLSAMTNVELLERISDALYQINEGLSVSLGI
jgi:uncharacterized protein YaaR (DUF327 family)